VRGTSFEFDTINLSVNEGTVAFSGNLGPAEMVKAGGESFIKVDGDPADPIGTKADSLLPSAPVGTVPDEAHTTLPFSTGDINY
jgi:hypothetical protein